jgi:hypothetical protein
MFKRKLIFIYITLQNQDLGFFVRNVSVLQKANIFIDPIKKNASVIIIVC